MKEGKKTPKISVVGLGKAGGGMLNSLETNHSSIFEQYHQLIAVTVGFNNYLDAVTHPKINKAFIQDKRECDKEEIHYLCNRFPNLALKFQEGDTLYIYKTPPMTWKNLAGWEWCSLQREGVEIHFETLKMN